jgi:hypothetical protein
MIEFLDTLVQCVCVCVRCTTITQVEIIQNNPLRWAQFKAEVSDCCFETLLQPNCLAMAL